MVKIKSISIKNICFFLLCLFLFDSAFHVSNNLLNGSNILRLGMMAVMLFFAVIPILYKPIIVIKQVYFPITFFSFLLLLGMFRTMAENGDMEFAISYIKYGFVYLLYIPILIYVIRTERDIKNLSKVVLGIGTMISGLSIILVALWFVSHDMFWGFTTLLYKYKIANIILPVGSTVRIMMSGIIFQVIAIFASLYNYIIGRKSIYLYALLINLMGILLSYSRGIILGVVVGMLLWFIWTGKFNQKYKKNIRYIIAAGILVLVAVVVYMVLGSQGNVFYYLFERFLGDNVDTLASDSFRDTMMEMIRQKIWQHPILGGGLGSHIDLRDGAIEMTYQDLIIRTGFIGLILFLSPYFFMIVSLMKKTDFYVCKVCFFAALTVAMIATYTNPYLITSTGMFIYCFCIHLFSMKKNGAILACD